MTNPITPAEYSHEERTTLLRIARDSIGAALDGQALHVDDAPKHLMEARGAFTTLHIAGQLRGCIGFVEPLYPLVRTVAETARAAAFEDPRFYPLTPAEFEQIDLEISVMSLLRPIAAEDVVVGVHGLMISQRGHRGLLLPQVAPEWGWDRETFLAETCRKAGLPPDAWKNGATIEAFTAEVFGER